MDSIGGNDGDGVGRKEKVAPHVLFVPHSAWYGHVAPMLTLARQLAREGVTITFAIYEDLIPHLKLADGWLELQGLDFRVMGLKNPGPPEKNTTRFESNLLRDSFEPLMENMLHDKSSGVAGPTSILSDMFLPWTQDVADKLQIPRYYFVSSGVIYARVFQGCAPLFEQDQFQISETYGELVKFDGSICIPGLPPLRYLDLPNSLRVDPAYSLLRSKLIWRAKGVLVNSFLELEEKVVESWRSAEQPQSEHVKVPKIYPVGPLFSTTSSSVEVGGLKDSSSKCLPWLNCQPSASVLYVAFGSHIRLRPEQIAALALGLEGSNQRFVWVIPQLKVGSEVEALSLTEVLPPGFEDRVGDRGCIVTSWAPQLQILAHSSTGCFLTHCGWNSCMESISLGVPMIAWPQAAEQHLNCRYVVDDLKVADQIRTVEGNNLKQGEVERAANLLMVESEGKEMRSRVKKLQKLATVATAEGGSQSRAFQEYLDEIRNQ